MKWWTDVLNQLATTKEGRQELEDNKLIIDELEKLMDVTSVAKIKDSNEDELKKSIIALVDLVGKLKSKTIIVEDGSSVNLKSNFERMLIHLQKRTDKKWEEEVLSYLNAVRKKKNINQTQFSKMTGISHSYINRINSGKRVSISLNMFSMMCDALDLRMSEVLSGVEDTNLEGLETAETPSLEDVIFKSSFEIDGELVSSKQKKAIINLITQIYRMRLYWEENMLNINKVIEIAKEYFKS